jgi:hypothetical protein
MKKNAVLLAVLWPLSAFASAPQEVAGIYPSLAMFNAEGECGTGAVVPWAGSLWAITYAPHAPYGSSDKLYEITPNLRQIIRPESVGGTPACRMIHEETNQLLIGPYLIDESKNVRVIPPFTMPGRLTGIARHLAAPGNKAYYATMEEGLYELDLQSLEVKCVIREGGFFQIPEGAKTYPEALVSALPGYHGKGLYSGQGRLVYANNGERSKAAEADPKTPSGALAEWRGSGDWELVRRNQFTEVTGPGGIYGNQKPSTDPLWSVGWDHRSLILMLLENGKWHSYRLPKASHCYDGAHGWNTEWPRIRDIGEQDLLMTMHGMFWKFPKGFSLKNASGIRPRSTYLKVIGDFCRWNEKLVFGCDDTAKSEFLNKRPAKGGLAGPGQSQSNLWFVEPAALDNLGPVLGRGGVWVNDVVSADTPSEPFLFADFPKRSLFIRHGASGGVRFDLEVDQKGDGKWGKISSIEVTGNEPEWIELPPSLRGEWIRLRADRDCADVTAWFCYSAKDKRPAENDPLFSGLAASDAKQSLGGFLRTRGGGKKTLGLLSTRRDGNKSETNGTYELDANLNLVRKEDPELEKELAGVMEIPQGILQNDNASAIYKDPQCRTWRLPRLDGSFAHAADARMAREVCTERDLFNCGGTFYELPAENAGGIAKVRPVATHGLRIQDYCSYRGLLVMTGIDGSEKNPRIVRSSDAQAAVWLGVADDLWKLGKPRGKGGPWMRSQVRAGIPSDPFLMTGFDQKRLDLSNEGDTEAEFTLEADVTGDGSWAVVKRFRVKPGETIQHTFPAWFQACWARLIPSQDAVATAQFTYE